MAIQNINLGTAPNGVGGDTLRSTATKINENFSNATHAASRLVGTASGNLMEVGAFGFGSTGLGTSLNSSTDGIGMMRTGTYKVSTSSIYANSRWSNWGGNYAMSIGGDGSFWAAIIHGRRDSGIKEVYFRSGLGAGYDDYRLYHDNNTTVVNGNLKPSSPVVKIHMDSLELNGDAEKMGVTLNKRGVGDYLIQNTTGLRKDDGWYIELPQDVNGNPYFAVDYNELENNDIEVKTYKRIFNMNTFMFVPDFDNPIDIKEGRYIAIRFNDLPVDYTELDKEPTEPYSEV